MNQIRATQIKMARACLGWSQEDLARATSLSIATIRNLELGTISPRRSTYDVIRSAVEGAGLEFIEPDGVRRRLDDVRIFQGPDSSEELFEDMMQTIKRTNSDVNAVVKSQESLFQSLGMAAHSQRLRLEKLSEYTEIRCLFSDDAGGPINLPCVQFRAISKHYVGPVPYFIYGDKHVLVLAEGGANFRFIVFHSASVAQTYRTHFLALWDCAFPMTAPVKGVGQGVGR